MVPTEDTKVVETHLLTARLHGRVSCLVDGDDEGLFYAGRLQAAASPPVSIIRWKRRCHDASMH